MSNPALQALADDLARDRRVSADEALALRKSVFPDGVVSRDEAEVLVALEARVEGGDVEWGQAFVEAVVDCVSASSSYVDDSMAAWLVSQFSGASPRPLQMQVLVRVLERADGAPETLHHFVRERLSAFVAGRALESADVELMRHCLYAGDNAVSEDEARWLFAVDAESDGRANDASWSDLFVKAQLCHLMGRQAPANTEASRQAWLAPNEKFEPLSNLLNVFKGGMKGYWQNVRPLGDTDRLETYYEAANANAEEDAELTAMERAWALKASNEDGKLTANEQKLLAELQKLESAA